MIGYRKPWLLAALLVGAFSVLVSSSFYQTNSASAQATATLVINKQTIGGEDSFFMELTPGVGGETKTLFTIATVSGFGSTSFQIESGIAYELSEPPDAQPVPGLWALTSATCDNGDDPSAVTASAGQTVTCTFVNTNTTATLIINKQAVGGDDRFFMDLRPGHGFSGEPATLFNIETTNGFGTQTFPIIGGMTYELEEPAGAQPVPGLWALTSATCDNGDDPTSIAPEYGEIITCTFVNTNTTATLIVNKEAIGGDDTFFMELIPGAGFSGESATIFDITTVNGFGTETFALKGGETFELEEVPGSGPPDEWVQKSATCDNGDELSSITPEFGEVITCTFTNTRVGDLIIVKNATGVDDTFQFAGTGDGIDSSFSITTSGGLGNQSFIGIERGNKTVTEQTPLPSGWAFLGIECSDPDEGTTVSGTTINVDLDVGETITCTYYNEKLIDVTKSFTKTDVRFSKCPPSLGTPLATDSDGNYLANVLFVKGTKNVVSSTNPGQIYGVVSIEGVSSDVNSLTLNDTLPVDWKINPASVPGGVTVLFIPDGSKCAVDITKSADISITQASIPASGQPGAGTRAEVNLELSDVSAAAGQALADGDKILVYIKLEYGLKGLTVDTTQYPVVDPNFAEVHAFKQVNFTGIEAVGQNSAPLKVIKK